jgi:hypothetical protein
MAVSEFDLFTPVFFEAVEDVFGVRREGKFAPQRRRGREEDVVGVWQIFGAEGRKGVRGIADLKRGVQSPHNPRWG